MGTPWRTRLVAEIGSNLEAGRASSRLGESVVEIDDMLLERDRNADCWEEANKRWVESS
jgi:hypothetical protein